MKIKLMAVPFAALLLTSCAGVFPPSPQSMVETAKAQGCTPKRIETADSISSRFLSYSSNRSTKVECQ